MLISFEGREGKGKRLGARWTNEAIKFEFLFNSIFYFIFIINYTKIVYLFVIVNTL